LHFPDEENASLVEQMFLAKSALTKVMHSTFFAQAATMAAWMYGPDVVANEVNVGWKWFFSE